MSIHRARSSLLLVPFLAVAAAGAAIDDLRSPDPLVRHEAIVELRETPGVDVSEAFVRLLRDPDPDVREAAVRALGPRRDEISIRALRQALDRFEKDEAILPTVLVAIGESGDATLAGEVFKLGRKALGSDPAIADAAILALGGLRSHESVAGLVELLGTAEPVRGGSAARTGQARYVTGIRGSLQTLTGLPFREGATWRAWWRHAKRDWRPTPADPSEERGLERRDDGWRFAISRPDAARWAFERVPGAALRIRWIGSGDEAGTTWIDVLAHATAERDPRTVEEQARLEAEGLRAELSRDVKSMRLGEAGRIGAEPALVHEAIGRQGSGRVVKRRVHVLERNGLLYTVSVHVASGPSERVDREIEAMLASFRLLDR